MVERLDDTWGWREYPVLLEAVRGADADPYIGIRLDEIARITGLNIDDVQRATRALEDANLIATHGVSPVSHSRINRVAPEARQLTGAWPTPQNTLDRMVDALEAIASNTDADDDTRSRARKALDAVRGGTRDVLIASLATAISGQVPGVGS